MRFARGDHGPGPARARRSLRGVLLALLLLLPGMMGCDPTAPGPDPDPEPRRLVIHAERALVRHPQWRGGAPETIELGLPLVVPSGIGMQLSALAISSSDDTAVVPMDEVEWSTSAPSVMTISEVGFATAHAPGEALVRLRRSGDVAWADSAPALALPGYALTNLGFTPTALNDHGQVVGFSDGAAMLWDGSGSTALGSWSPTDINNSGVIVGSRRQAYPNPSVPVVWRDGVLEDLTVGEFERAGVSSINDAGTMVGLASSEAETFGVIWLEGRLDTLPSAGPYASVGTTVTRGVPPSIGVVRIEEDGVVLGQVGGQAVAWVEGERVPIDTMRVAFDRDRAGSIVGTIEHRHESGTIVYTAAAWHPPDELRLYGSGVNACCSRQPVIFWAGLLALNDAGVMVGEHSFYGADPLYVHPGLPPVRLKKLLDLPQPEVEPVPGFCGAAVDINESGQIIVGGGAFYSMCQGAVLLDPLPF